MSAVSALQSSVAKIAELSEIQFTKATVQGILLLSVSLALGQRWATRIVRIPMETREPGPPS